MFGYIRPPESALSETDKAVYRAVYCSLCRELRSFGFGAKLFLNYDFVFAALLAMSQHGGESEPRPARCNTYPHKKVSVIDDPVLTRCAAALIITCRHKLDDDRADEGFFKGLVSRALSAVAGGAYKRAAASLGDFDLFLRSQLERQAELESRGCPSFDEAADPTAKGLSFLLSELADERNKKVFARLGYLIGRFVYLADAADDLEQDIRHGRYNTAVYALGLSQSSGDDDIESARGLIRGLMRETAASAELCRRLIDTRRFGGIIDAVIYGGLEGAVRSVGTKQGRRRGDDGLA